MLDKEQAMRALTLGTLDNKWGLQNMHCRNWHAALLGQSLRRRMTTERLRVTTGAPEGQVPYDQGRQAAHRDALVQEVAE
jgi:hypothetical protein